MSLLMLDLISRALPGIFIAVVTMFCITWMRNRGKHAKPKFLENQSGTIAPGKLSAWLTVIIGSIMVVGGVLLLFVPDALGVALGLIAMGGAIAGFMSPSLTSMHDLNWTDTHVEGPSNLFGPTLGKRRTTINWTDITKTGTTATSYTYIESNDGRRIYWSYLYRGHGVFEDTLLQKCPHLAR